jgi:D-alanyl-D-alanine carboxypeptidase
VEGADGVKTGYTKAAGRILVSSATREGRRIIVVTMNDPNDWKDHAALLESGFSRFAVKEFVKAGAVLGHAEVAGGEYGSVELLAEKSFSFAVTEDETFELVLPTPGFVYAPVVQGQQAGFAHVMLDGAAVGKIPLIYGATVERTQDEKKGLLDRIKHIFS